MKKYAVVLLALSLLAGCAKNISSDEYAEDDVGSITQTYKGVIIASRPVKVTGGDSLSDNKAGAIGGGVAGGLLGSQLGQGRGSVVGLVVGAAAGALGGSLAEKGLKSQEGMEYTIELDSGRIMTIVQGIQPTLYVGQHVLVMVGSKGRSRIVADQYAVQRPIYTHSRTVSTKKGLVKRNTTRSVDDIDYESRDRYARDQVR